MAAHNNLGKAGEEAAVAYLQEHGYVIRHRNWHKNHLELDIVAAKSNELIVVEVKTRADTLYQEPHEAVNWKKRRNILIATDAYLKHFRLDTYVRFDIITVVGKEPPFHIEHIQEAFTPTSF